MGKFIGACFKRMRLMRMYRKWKTKVSRMKNRTAYLFTILVLAFFFLVRWRGNSEIGDLDEYKALEHDYHEHDDDDDAHQDKSKSWNNLEYSPPSWRNRIYSNTKFLLATGVCFIIPPENYIHKQKKDKKSTSAKSPNSDIDILRLRAQALPPIKIYSNLYQHSERRSYQLVNREPGVNCSIYRFENGVSDINEGRLNISEFNAKGFNSSIRKIGEGFPPSLKTFFDPAQGGDVDFLVECTNQSDISRKLLILKNPASYDDLKKAGNIENTNSTKIVFHKYHSIIRITNKLTSIMSHWKPLNFRPNLPPDLIIISLNSLSRAKFINYMPRTYSYLQHTGFMDMRGFTSLSPEESSTNSDSNSQNSNHEHEHPNQHFLQERIEDEWIQTLFEKLRTWNYATFYGEEENSAGNLNLIDEDEIVGSEREIERTRFENGLSTTFSTSKILKAARISRRNKYSRGDDRKILFEYVSDLVPFLNRKIVPLAVFLRLKLPAFSSSTSLDEAEEKSLSTLDNQIQSFLRKVLQVPKASLGFRKNYLVTVFSFQSQGQSQGQTVPKRLNSIYNEYENLVNQRLAVLQMRFPITNTNNRRSNHWRILNKNVKNLITPSDVLKTILKFACNEEFCKDQTILSRTGIQSYDLVHDLIGEKRSCLAAGISKNHCPCNSDASFNPRKNHLSALFIAKLAVDKINKEIISGKTNDPNHIGPSLKDMCSLLTFVEVIGVDLQLRFWDETINGTSRERFKNKFSPEPKPRNQTEILDHPNFEFIRIRFKTAPNDAIFSTIVKFNIAKNIFNFRSKLDWIARFDNADPSDYNCITRKAPFNILKVKGKRAQDMPQLKHESEMENYLKLICYCLDRVRASNGQRQRQR